MRILALFVCLLGAGLAQSQLKEGAAAPAQAPPEVDTALREHVKTFYQAHVDGKFRVADQVVAEDSKDAFFEAEKPRYLSYEILGITYLDNFTRARVTVNCESDMTMPGAGRIRVKIPLTTQWKAVDGQWYWYVEQKAGRETPFGWMKAGPPASGAAPFPKGPNIDEIQALVKADKSEVRLSADEASSDQVTISNGMPGAVTLTLQAPKLAGFEAKLDRTELRQNQSARLTLRYEPPEGGSKPAPAVVYLRVDPISQTIPVQVRWGAPAAKPPQN